MEDDERKETLFRDKYGDLREWVVWLVGILVFLGIIVLIIGFCIGISAISDYYEVKAFNRIHGTDYTFGEWFWAQSTIKDYHLGPIENLNVDLNIKGLKGGTE